jgi:hypothetical protein
MAGVVVLSVWRRRNLATPMLTGRVEGVGPDLIRSNHVPLAAMLLAAVVSFWVWQWQDSPRAQDVDEPVSASAGALHPAHRKAQSEDDD